MDIADKIAFCEKNAREMRKRALEMSYAAGPVGAHLGGGLSLIEIMAALYGCIMKYRSDEPMWEGRDRCIFSKGHGTLALYTALSKAGFIPDVDLDSYKSNDTYLFGHPSMNMNIGVEFSSGSLGQGLSLAVGSALALIRKQNQESRIYVILGDGECNEGSIWEAAMSASHYELNNIVAIVDQNQLQYDGKTENIMNMGSTWGKWTSFGWDVQEIDGHNMKEIVYALHKKSDKPMVILANTIKGKGVSFMELNAAWHHSRLSKEQYDKALSEQEGE